MKRAFLLLTFLLLMAEAAPYLWFHRDQYQFFGLDANSAVRRVSLRGGRADDQLSFDRGTTYFADTGGQVEISVLTWDEENSHGLVDAFGHSPDVCLPVSGAKLLESFPVRQLEVDGHRFLVESWMFAHPAFEKNIYAFKFAHSANTAMTKLATGNKLVAARFFLFKERRTIPPIEIVVGTVRGTNHPDVAWQRFASFVQGNFILEQPNLLIL